MRGFHLKYWFESHDNNRVLILSMSTSIKLMNYQNYSYANENVFFSLHVLFSMLKSLGYSSELSAIQQGNDYGLKYTNMNEIR